MKQYLDFDPESGIAHWVDTDEETGISTYGMDQDVSAILDQNKREYNADHGKWGEWRHVGSIPMSLYNQWAAEGILDDQKALARKLNDIDFRSLRTRPGNI